MHVQHTRVISHRGLPRFVLSPKKNVQGGVVQRPLRVQPRMCRLSVNCFCGQPRDEGFSMACHQYALAIASSDWARKARTNNSRLECMLIGKGGDKAFGKVEGGTETNVSNSRIRLLGPSTAAAEVTVENEVSSTDESGRRRACGDARSSAQPYLFARLGRNWFRAKFQKETRKS